MNDYPVFRVKVILEQEFKINETHKSIIKEYIDTDFNNVTEIDAIKSAIDALRIRYYELDSDRQQDI